MNSLLLCTVLYLSPPSGYHVNKNGPWSAEVDGKPAEVGFEGKRARVEIRASKCGAKFKYRVDAYWCDDGGNTCIRDVKTGEI